jgi:4-amino-4-deoxy-L-arabinose transferase-like glycosyltransferase
MTSERRVISMMEKPSVPYFAPSKWILRFVLLVIFSAGLAVRLYDLTDPPLDFHPHRQIHSAILARGFFAEMEDHLPDFERDRSKAMGNSEMWIEPPLLESLTAITYYLVGGEILWAARLYSIIFWLAGGVALFYLAKRLSGIDGAVFALLYYLILPYGVIASRSFQPDPLMVCLMILTALAVVRWAESPTWKSTLVAGLLAGTAIVTKQVAVFMVFGAISGVVVAELGLLQAVRNLKVWALGGLALLPMAVYNFYGVFISGFLAGQYNQRFFPSLFTDPAYYLKWLGLIDKTVTLPALLVSLVGILLIRGRRERGLMAGLVLGYVVYGIVFAYHISTHDYYHLPLIPVVALGLAPAAGFIIQRARELQPGRLAGCFLLGVILLGGAANLLESRTTLKKVDYRQEPVLWQKLAKDMGYDQAAVIGIFNDYGARLQYWGYTIPAVWPSGGDIRMEELSGRQVDMGDIASKIEGKQYFIITDFEEFERQAAVKKILYENFPIFSEGNGYLIFDLRNPLRDGKGLWNE